MRGIHPLSSPSKPTNQRTNQTGAEQAPIHPHARWTRQSTLATKLTAVVPVVRQGKVHQSAHAADHLPPRRRRAAPAPAARRQPCSPLLAPPRFVARRLPAPRCNRPRRRCCRCPRGAAPPSAPRPAAPVGPFPARRDRWLDGQEHEQLHDLPPAPLAERPLGVLGVPAEPVEQCLLHLHRRGLLPREVRLRRRQEVAVVLQGERRARDLDSLFFFFFSVRFRFAPAVQSRARRVSRVFSDQGFPRGGIRVGGGGRSVNGCERR